MARFSPIRRSDRQRPELASSGQRRLGDEWIEFHPARWLVAALTLLTVWLARPSFGKRALLALAWQFTPRRLKLIAGGAAAVALIVLAGSVAVLLLALNQLV